MLPSRPRGAPRVDDRRVLNGIFEVLRTGALWLALPREYGPRIERFSHLHRHRSFRQQQGKRVAISSTRYISEADVPRAAKGELPLDHYL